MDEEPIKCGDAAGGGDGKICWTVAGGGPVLGGMPEVPKIVLPPEVVQGFTDTNKR